MSYSPDFYLSAITSDTDGHSLSSLRAIVRALLVTGPPNTKTAFQKVVKQRLRRQRLDHSQLPLPSTLYATFNSRHHLPYSSHSPASSSSSLPSYKYASSSYSTSSSHSGSPRLSATHELSSPTIPDTDPSFTLHAQELQSRARALFGAGLGLSSLPLLTLLINGTQSLRWSEDGSFVDSLAILDGDVSQAIQSSLEEMATMALSESGMDAAWAEEGRKAVYDLQATLKACETEVEAWNGEFPFQRGLANVEWLEQSDAWAKLLGSR